ncbi:MAG: hypothetical protein UHO61_09010 [Acutalibacteraceae bacterium]|nr:hypothetical protein [Acutalibacteraceae bacterium]
MVSVNATDVRKNWSTYLDNVRSKPVFIKRTHDFSALMDIDSLKLALSYVPVTYSKLIDEDGSIVISSNDMDVVSTGKNEQEALSNFANDLFEYAQEFYDEFEFWSSAPNRAKHVPMVLKILTSDSLQEVEEMLICQNGQN